MSGLDVGYAKGLRFGGLPPAALRAKFEASEGGGAAEDDYDAFVRAQIVDWGPDAPFLESDQTRRDPSLGRSILNLRYNATRGSNAGLPRHPDLFIGFLGNDPRGAGTDPRFERSREFAGAKAAELEVRFGRNDDSHLAESPWTGQAVSFARKEMLEQVRGRARVFTASKLGQARGLRYAPDPAEVSQRRAQQEAGFADGVPRREPEAPGRGLRGDAPGLLRATAGGALGVALLGGGGGAGRARLGAGAQGGGRLGAAGADQAWGASGLSRGATQAFLGASMAAAARRAGARAGGGDQTQAEGFVAAPLGLAPLPGADPARAARRAEGDHAAGEDLVAAPLGLGPLPGADPGAALRGAEARTAGAAGRLANVGAIVQGLREGSAASRRRIAGLVSADGARGAPFRGREGGRGPAPAADTGRAARRALGEEAAPGAAGLEGPAAGRTPGAGADPGRAARLAELPLAASAAAGGLEVHAYRAAPLPAEKKAAAAFAGDDTAWRASREALPSGASRAPEWRSATQGQTTPGDEAGRVFGAARAVAPGGAAVGPKRLRAPEDGATLVDGFDAGSA